MEERKDTDLQMPSLIMPTETSVLGQFSVILFLGGEIKAITNVETFKQRLFQRIKQNLYKCDSFTIDCNF